MLINTLVMELTCFCLLTYFLIYILKALIFSFFDLFILIQDFS